MLKTLISTEEGTGPQAETQRTWPVKKIIVKPQARKKFDRESLEELAQSIKDLGLLHPVIVDANGNLKAGERRLRACRDILKWIEIPVTVNDELDGENGFFAMLAENEQRQDLTPMEKAWSYQEAVTKYKKTQDQIAARIHKSRPYVANIMRLLKLPGTVQELIQEGALTAGHANELLALGDKVSDIVRLANDCISSDWTVLELRQNVSFVLNKLKPQPAPATQAPAQPAASSQAHPDEHLDPAFGAAIKQQPDNSVLKAPASTTTPAPAAANGNVVQTQSGGFSATNAKPVAPPVAEIDAARNDALYEQFQAEDEQAEIYLSQPEPGDTTALTFFDGQVLIQLGRLDVDLSNVLEKYTGYRVSITVDLFTEKGATSFDQITVGEGATR